jgi:hypothetical protein
MSSPARAWMRDDLPDPGTPYNKYPRRKGIPRSAYHCMESQMMGIENLGEKLSADLLGLEKVLCVSYQHLLDARI